MNKKILLSIAAIFLFWQSCKILSQIHTLETDSWGILLLIAWIINLFITGVFAFLGFAFPTQKLIPSSYYAIHHPKRLKKKYMTCCRSIFLEEYYWVRYGKASNKEKSILMAKGMGIANLEEQSMKSEFGHLVPFVILTLVSVFLILIGQAKLGTLSFLVNTIGNFYPIILQRYHRMRILLIMKRGG